MTTDIQQARDVLAKWREGANPGPWHSDAYEGTGLMKRKLYYQEPEQIIPTSAAEYLTPGDARLIVGTAGNPDLLDAIDDILATAVRTGTAPTGVLIRDRARRIAAAIIAADERMSS